MMNKYSEEIWNDNYRGPGEETIEQTWKRLATEAAKVENKEIRKQISDEFYSILENFKFIPGGRIMANLGIDTRHATTLMNCVSGNTKIHTDKGIFYAKDLSDTEVNVLSEDGIYRPSKWYSYGHQELYKIILANEDILYATGEHEWVIRNNKGGWKRIKTVDLENSFIPLVGNATFTYDEQDYLNGVKHGLVFGDGWLYMNGEYSMLRQYGDSKHLIEDYFESYTKSHDDAYLSVTHLENKLKSLPSTQESRSYLRGFIAGYVGADGHVDTNGHVMLHCKDKEVLQEIRIICTYAELPTTNITLARTHSPFDGSYKPLWKLSLVKKYMYDEKMIVKNSHKHNMFNSKIPEKYTSIKVISVENTHNVEEVYCCVEEETHTMVIDNCYLTGQCYVHHPKDINYRDPDSIEGIYTMLKAQAHTLKSEGGYGMNFSWIRPAGTYVKGIGSRTPGVLKFMELWDKSSEIITMGSEKILGELRDDEKSKIRKGAQMAVLSVWHPEIEDYVIAKQTPGRLTKFNMSIGITNGFMKAVENDEDWQLIFPDTEHPKYEEEWNGDIKDWKSKGYKIIVHKTVKAKALWETISYATYTRNEPGVIFLDLFNKLNALSYGEDIFATNPCVTGETLIAVADGRNAVSIEQLAKENKPVNIYTIDNGKTTIGTATNIFKTGNKPVLKLTLDDGSSIKLTEDHKVMLRNGEYVCAKDLKFGDSLMPFKSYVSNKRYRQILSNVGRDRRQYRMIAEHNDLIVDPKNTAIHHIDFDSYNDNINNLKAMPHSEHRKIHNIEGDNNPMIKWYPTASKEEKINYHDSMSKAVSGEKNGRFSGIDNNQLLQYGIRLTLDINRQFTSNEWVLFAEENNLPKSFSKYRKEKYGTLYDFARQCATKCNFIPMGKYELRSYIRTQNHKVVSIEECGIETVYDMIVPKTNNFGIITSHKDDRFIESSGVFVHNCGEIGMATGVCNLGSLNLTKFVKTVDNKLVFDYDEYARCVKLAIRYLDNINDISRAPLKEYKDSMTEKRRVGLGNMGLGSLLIMFGIRYGSDESLELVKNIYKLKAETELLASASLGKEKGNFKLFDKDKYFSTYWWNNLKISPSVKEELIKIGHMRNSHHSMNAPNGNSSIYAGIVTGGIEPAFLLEYTRWAIVTENERRSLRKKGFTWPDPLKGEWFETDHMKFTIKGDEQILHGIFEDVDYEVDKNRGLVKATLVSDYGWEFAKNIYKDKLQAMQSSGLFASAMELSVTDHINVLKVVAHYTNMNNSKTVNIPSEYSYEDFKSLYMDAWKSSIKGLTTYRAGTMTAVLETQKAKIYQNELEKQFAEAGDKVIQNVAKIPNEYFAQGFKIKDNGRKKWYINLAFVDKALTRPYAIFVSTNNIESSDVTEELIKSMENLLIDKGLPKKLIEDQIQKYENQKNTTRIARIIGMALRHNLKIQDIVEVLDKYPHELSSFVFHLSKLLARYIQDGTKVKKEKCPACKTSSIVYQDGCKTCITCGWSKC